MKSFVEIVEYLFSVPGVTKFLSGGCPRTVWKSSLGASVNEAKVVKIPTATNFVIIHRHSVLLIQFVVMFLEVTAEERYKLLTGKLRVSHYQNAERLELQIRKISQTHALRAAKFLSQ